MICLILDRRETERDIFAPNKHESFSIRSLAGESRASFPAPSEGWTLAALNALIETHSDLQLDGADAFLGSSWVGSTEV